MKLTHIRVHVFVSFSFLKGKTFLMGTGHFSVTFRILDYTSYILWQKLTILHLLNRWLEESLHWKYDTTPNPFSSPNSPIAESGKCQVWFHATIVHNHIYMHGTSQRKDEMQMSDIGFNICKSWACTCLCNTPDSVCKYAQTWFSLIGNYSEWNCGPHLYLSPHQSANKAYIRCGKFIFTRSY